MLPSNALIRNRYLVNQRIGGATSAVYEVIDLPSRVRFALKLFAVGAWAAEFERVARPLKGLRHPNLPIISDWFVEGESGFLVMDLVPGDDLAMALERSGGSVPADRVLHLADQLIDALDYMHTQPSPVIHGDIRPQNIKLRSDDQIVLLGFSVPLDVAHAPQAPHEDSARPAHLPFLSPEQASGSAPTERSDLYALAATLYYLLTGTPPMVAKEAAGTRASARTGSLRPAHALNRRMPAGLSAAITQALAPNPAQRPNSAAHMRAIIKQPAPPPQRWFLPVMIAAAAVVLIALIVLGSSIFGNQPSPPPPPPAQIGGAATSLPAPTRATTADVSPTTTSTHPIAAQETIAPGPSPSAIAVPTSIIQPDIDSIEPQQLFTGTLPLTMAVRGVGLDQVRMAQLVADGRPPIELTLLTSSAELLTLKIGAPSEPLNGAVPYRMQLDGVVQESPEIILRDFVEQTTIQGVEAQYIYTERVAVDRTGAYTRMRTAPNIGSQPIGLLRNGDQVDILRIDIPAWYLVRYNTADGAGQIGWLERWLVAGREAPIAPSPTPTPAPQVFVGRISKTATDAAVQCGASLFESTIYGTVETSTGSGINGAVLRVTSADGRNVFRATTNRKGEYKVTNLGCTRWTVRLISIPNAPSGIRTNVVSVSNLNGGIYTSAQVLFRMQR
jgi:serine/threonine protein kinase